MTTDSTAATATAKLVWSTSDLLRLKLRANDTVALNSMYEYEPLPDGLTIFDEDGDEIRNASFICIRQNYSIQYQETRYYFTDVVAERPSPPPQQQLVGQQTAQPLRGLFTVFVRNHNTSVTNVIKFYDKIFPSTVDEFWRATGLERTVGSACVTVKMQNGWEKLSGNPKDTNTYVGGDEAGFGILFQLSPHHTPTSSPIKDDYIGIEAEEESDFPECIQNLFGENPFNAAIPELYEDEAIRGLGVFFQQGRTKSLVSEVKTLAMMFAMPPSADNCKSICTQLFDFSSRLATKTYLLKLCILTKGGTISSRTVSRRIAR
jgi:hypothetical protein